MPSTRQILQATVGTCPKSHRKQRVPERTGSLSYHNVTILFHLLSFNIEPK
jgi:hypothetical protein